MIDDRRIWKVLRSIFFPAINLLNRFGFTAKFTLLWVLPLIAIAVVVQSLFVSLNETVKVSKLELQGLALIEPVSRSVQLLQEHRGISTALLSGNKAMKEMHDAKEREVIDALNALERALPTHLASGKAFLNIKAEWERLHKEFANHAVDDFFTGSTRLIKQLMLFELLIADNYALITDNQLTTFYLIDAITIKIPHMLEYLGQLRAYGTGILVSKKITGYQKTQLNIFIAELASALDDLSINVNKVGHHNPELREALGETYVVVKESAGKVTNMVQTGILNENFTILPDNFFGVATASINNGYIHIYQTLLPTTSALIRERITNAEEMLYLIVGTALLLLLLAVYISASIYYATISSVKLLVHSAQTFAEGDLNQRIRLDTRDELRLVADSFNTMADSFSDMLERQKQAEKKLRVAQQNETKALHELQVMLDTSGEGLWKTDQSGHIIEVNDAYCHLIGYAKDEIIGAHVSKFEALEKTPEDIAAHSQLVMKRGFDRFETMHRHRDGHLLDIEVSASFIPETGFFIVFLHDITIRKRTQADLQHSRDLLNEAQQLGQLGSWELDPTSGELWWSDETYRIFELDPAKVSPSYENFLNTVHPDDRDMVDQAYAQSLKNHQPYNIEHRLLFADGRIKWVREHCSNEFDASGKPWRSTGAVQDITEQYIAAEQLHIAAVTFETQEAIIITDPEANILRVNRAFENLTGYSAEEVIGKNPSFLQSGRHDAAFYKGMWSALLDTGEWSGEIWDRRKGGEIYPKYINISAVYNTLHQVTHYVGVASDISERKKAEQEIYHLAFFDPLTKLPNRRLLLDRLQQAMAGSGRTERYGAVLFLDMDNFKTINDTQGHTVGDLLLIEVAQRLNTSVRESDSVARLGGDEFVVILEDLDRNQDKAAANAGLAAENIRGVLSQPYMLEDYQFYTTPSIGITLFQGHTESEEVLLKHADIAMYHAKSAGRNTTRFFDPHMQVVLDNRHALESDMHEALDQQQFRLYYQAQVDRHGKVTGAEVLLRWEHPEHGMIAPDQFISMAEETGMIVQIGLWALETACTQLKAWQHTSLTRDLMLSVNVSGRQFYHTDFVADVRRVLLESGAKPSRLKLELTESTALENVEETIARMHEIKSLGVNFSIDDFGTGSSSLQYLKILPLDQIKIDRSFVSDITHDPNDAAIVQAIIVMSKALGLKVIAEGVETEAQWRFLGKHGCYAYQGHLFSKPVPLEQFEALLKKPGKKIFPPDAMSDPE